MRRLSIPAGIVRIGGGEDNARAHVCDHLGELQAVEFGHLDVTKDQIDRMLL